MPKTWVLKYEMHKAMCSERVAVRTAMLDASASIHKLQNFGSCSSPESAPAADFFSRFFAASHHLSTCGNLSGRNKCYIEYHQSALCHKASDTKDGTLGFFLPSDTYRMTAASALTFLFYLNKWTLTLTSGMRHIATCIDFDVILPSRPWIVETAVWRARVRQKLTYTLHSVYTATPCYSMTRDRTRVPEYHLGERIEAWTQIDHVPLPRPSSSCKCCLPAVSNSQLVDTTWPDWVHAVHTCPYHEVLQDVTSKICWEMLRICGAQEKQTAWIQSGSDLYDLCLFFLRFFFRFFMVSFMKTSLFFLEESTWHDLRWISGFQ